MRRTLPMAIFAIVGLFVAVAAASAAQPVRADFTRLTVDCRKAGPNVTPFMEMDVAQTWTAATASFSGDVFNVPRSGGQRQKIGTIQGKTTASTIAFTIKESLTHEAAGTFPAIPESLSAPRATPMTAKLSGPVTVTGSTGDKFACEWASEARLTLLAEPVAAATVVPATAPVAARTLGPENLVTAPDRSAQGDVPIIPIAAGSLALIAGGAIALRTLRGSGRSTTSEGTADGIPGRQRFQDRAAGMRPPIVDRVGGVPHDAYAYDHAQDMARLERGREANEAEAALHGLDASFSDATATGAQVTGFLADRGVEQIKQVTGTPGKVVAYTYAGAKGTAGALAEGRSAGDALAQGFHDSGKAVLDDALQDGIGHVASKLTGKPTIEIPDSSKKTLSEFAHDAASGAAEAAQAAKNYVASEATSAVTGKLEEDAMTAEGPKLPLP